MGNTRAAGPGIAQSSSVKQKHKSEAASHKLFQWTQLPHSALHSVSSLCPLVPYRDMWDQFCPRKASWADPEGKHNLHVCSKHPITPSADSPEGHPGSGRRALRMRDVLRGGSANSPAAATAPFLFFLLSLCWARVSLSLSRGQKQDQPGPADLQKGW